MKSRQTYTWPNSITIIISCYELHICAPPNYFVETLTTNWMVLGNGMLRASLSNECGALMMGLVSFEEEEEDES